MVGCGYKCVDLIWYISLCCYWFGCLIYVDSFLFCSDSTMSFKNYFTVFWTLLQLSFSFWKKQWQFSFVSFLIFAAVTPISVLVETSGGSKANRTYISRTYHFARKIRKPPTKKYSIMHDLKSNFKYVPLSLTPYRVFVNSTSWICTILRTSSWVLKEIT